ncbi:MAG TPA: hypothetical protein VFQ51_09840 [Vicinamibacteria bacterium]|nr:hypothetical protein [Vicinamibacteria bacterium]
MSELRPHPYPYRATLAVCSDLDETPDRQVYEQIARYLNTTADTAMGPGLGLEVGNTIYFDMPPDQFAYWNTDDAGRDLVRALIRSGHIDCFHSFGDLATTRAHAGRALDELDRHGCRIEVWIDHARAATNLGADIMCGQGDLPGAPAYHADLTVAFGVGYVWRGRVTSVVGQDVRRRLFGIARRPHLVASTRTLAKEAAKGLLARTGSVKYAMHRGNAVMHDVRLRDGAPVREFLRCNPHWAAVDEGETADGLADVVVDPMLDTLVHRGGACVLYTHLGKVKDRARPFNAGTCAALARLAERQRRGELLVTTTRRLLGQRRAVREAQVRTAPADGGTQRVDVTYAGPPADLDGLTVYAADPERVTLVVNGTTPPRVVRNPSDHTGRASVSLPWPRLVYPA